MYSGCERVTTRRPRQRLCSTGTSVSTSAGSLSTTNLVGGWAADLGLEIVDQLDVHLGVLRVAPRPLVHLLDEEPVVDVRVEVAAQLANVAHDLGRCLRRDGPVQQALTGGQVGDHGTLIAHDEPIAQAQPGGHAGGRC